VDPRQLISKTFSLRLGNFDLAPTYWQAAAIVALLFLLVWTLARLRHMYVNWAIGKSAVAFLFWGFLLATVVEGFLILGGKTIFTEILGWDNAPKPIGVVLDAGRAKLIKTLGMSDEIPQSQGAPTYQSIVGDFEGLSSDDKETVRSFICE
jgi:hypothetical protein